ncbi:hypothetical protein CHU98_g4655 [Xylaria longipes]|nr:hypothetical protein CHU98_g4655 [Xylaria longipes]
MPKRALDKYKADNSRPGRRPHPKSNVAPHNRVDHLTHRDLSQAYGGANLKTFTRCANALKHNLDTSVIFTDCRVEREDLLSFFRGKCRRSDDRGSVAVKLAKLVPQFLIPKGYRVRKRLFSTIRRWHSHARENFDQLHIGSDGDGDPYCGSQLMRARQRVLLKADHQDEEAIAATDLGLIWAGVTNTVQLVLVVTWLND